MQPYWTGVFPAVTTQLKQDQSLDLPATARHLEALIASGVSGVIMCGSLGENQTLTAEEKRAELVAEAMEARAETLRTGKGYAASDVHEYIKKRARGRPVPRPEAKTWRR